MNYLNYNTGQLFIDGKKYELTKSETELLKTLASNELKTYAEIYNLLYKTNVLEIENTLRGSINSHIYRLRKKGLIIKTKYGYGVRLVNKIGVKI